ncbi:MAG: MBL fold metallo-hydrolase [Deltaproteobacteria bacterium]|nr:MBL fold metallo-hydrolase [Deltaproteobacteria bacterium]
MKRTGIKTAAFLMVLVFFLWSGAATSRAAGPKAADPVTHEMNSRLPEELPDDREEDECAGRGFMASDVNPDIRSEAGKAVWNMPRYDFLNSREPVPDTVNPALWRHARRNSIHGLFKVAEGIYQVRGYDISNITFIEGKTGYIIVDPLVSIETARAALDLFYRHQPRRSVAAVIYTHSHVDHWGGVKGVVSAEEVQAGKVRIIGPAGITGEIISENLMAGNAMMRRATYMFGATLPAGPRGQVDAGMGKAASSGTVSYIPPTEEITKPIEERVIDGVRFVFQQVPQTEAPVEMNFYLPERKALCVAEDATASLHNLLTPRGAQVRDGRAWYRAIDETIDLFGGGADVLFSTHLWPRFGNEKIVDYLQKQRDLYKYIHDQTVRLMNQGYTMTECAERIIPPRSLAARWYNRDFYGTVNFNVKAVYQRYLGWFDANPAHLHPLPPQEAGRKYVEFMGGSDAVLARARESMKKGEYRFVAEVVNHVVFAEPGNREARELQADALEQLGYQAESPIWRNFYLAGARELRHGVDRSVPVQERSRDILRGMPMDQFFDLMAVRLNSRKAEGKRITVHWVLTDTREAYTLTLANSVLNQKRGRKNGGADATVSLARPVFDSIMAKQATFAGRVLAGDIKVEGSMLKFLDMMSCVEEFDLWFNIVTP